ncbi:MAG: aldo/keto reductase [Spirochaetaceae bacterium]|nr:MAG: aldo/keto reductase [Spirochaetaceae bacterium]
MKKRKLGSTELEFTTIGFGSWAIGGGGWKAGWGPQDDNDSIAAIREAVSAGINWIDTAAVYGLGHSEEVVARALRDVPRSERPYVATKCGRNWSSDGSLRGDPSAGRIEQEITDSLKRLDVETIDLYQIHWPDPDEQIEEGWEVIAKHVRAGTIRYAGVCNFSVAQLDRIHAIHPVASLQPPYSMLRREFESELLPYCRTNSIGVVAYSPMQKGLLTGAITKERVANFPESDHRRRDPMFNEPKFSAISAFVEKLGAIAAEYDRTAAQLALAWVLRLPEVTSAIAGARRAGQITETAQAGDWTVPDDALQRIEPLLEQLAKDLA